MVARITFPKRVESALNYNEAKREKGVAVCLSAVNYLREASAMNFYQKLDGFERLNVLNDKATTKTVHVSLNFSPTEKLADSRLLDIADSYMQKIGFADQPYLVYKHEDAGHPHLHIVSTTIREDGSRINTHNIGRNQSEAARKEIENLFGLVRANGRAKAEIFQPKPVVLEKASYGKGETKRSIANVVGVVFNQYKFCSLPEFNAALRQFNVVADRGKEDGRIYHHRGLIYRLVDGNGNKIGVPIKASAMPHKPTVTALEKKFTANQQAKESLKPIVKNKLDGALKSMPTSVVELVRRLEAKDVHTVLRQNADGRLYGITFVDNQCKCVFNGSELGKEYSAAALQSKLAIAAQLRPAKPILLNQKEDVLAALISAKEQSAGLPDGLLKKKRKKKRRPPNA